MAYLIAADLYMAYLIAAIVMTFNVLEA